VKGFFNGDLRGESAAIDDLISAMTVAYEKGVGKRNPKLSCYYISTGNYEKPEKIESLRKNFRTDLEGLNIFDTNPLLVEFVGARDLQRWYRAATRAIEVEIDFPRNVVMPDNTHVEEAYIGYIDAKNLLKLYTSADSEGYLLVNKAVFFDNIRDYDPGPKINLSIKESVQSNGGAEFVFRNNGITVVSRSIDRTGDKFRLEDFQIVNGCQTSNVIFDLVYDGEPSKFNEDLAEQIQIPFRLIGSTNDEFVSSIIVGTNRQNPVTDEQFWALRPFMKSLEEYCRNLAPDQVLYLERREHQYRNQNIERTRIVQPAALMKAVAACLLFQPHRAGRDYRGILSEYEQSIFLDDHDVRIYHAVAYLSYCLEFLWRNQKVESAHKTFRHYILAGIGLRVTDYSNVFSLKASKIAQVAEAIIKLAKDEETLKAEVERIVSLVQSRLTDAEKASQERVRDTIRSESFSHRFRSALDSSTSA